MEKFFLRTFLTYNKLYIIDHKNIDGAVFFTKLVHRGCITASDGLDDLVGKFFGSHADNLRIRIALQDEMTDGMHQVCFAESRSSINIERIVCFTRRFRNCERSGVGKTVIASDNECIKRIIGIQIRFGCRFGIKRLFLPIRRRSDRLRLFRENELDLVFCSGDLCDCYFERQIIFLGNIAESQLLGRDKDICGVPSDTIKFKGT